MSGIKVSPWHPPSMKPVWAGVYELPLPFPFHYFDGEFCNPHATPEKCFADYLKNRNPVTSGYIESVPWRGVAI